MSEVVYIIGSDEARRVKIGRSVRPDKRLADIQRMSPVALRILWHIDGGSELEAALHRRFKPFRAHGEWFDFGDLDPVEQVSAAVDAIGADAVLKEAMEVVDREHGARSMLAVVAAMLLENDRAMEELVLEAHAQGQSLRQIAKDARMTPEGVRKMIARLGREAASADANVVD